MKRFKENLEVRKDQNLASLVLTLCFLIIFISITSSLSLNDKTVENSQKTAISLEKVTVVK
ncbi:MAG: hypothetical protein QG580_341 [Patescibacteria group bacterium]|jgi:hypothetical protein|nr:hypothetical protein [Patescibacteria group bacterium]